LAQRHIYAYFHSPSEAEAIAAKLRSLRATDIRIERIQQDWYGNGIGFLPGAKPWIGTLASDIGLTSMEPSAISSEEVPYDPSEAIENRDTLLTAAIDEEIYEKAVRLIRSGNGYVNE